MLGPIQCQMEDTFQIPVVIYSGYQLMVDINILTCTNTTLLSLALSIKSIQLREYI